MINIHRLKGVKVDAPLPVLTFDEAEAKIANIPGWAFYLTPHSSWFVDNKQYKERVNGDLFTTASTGGTVPQQYISLDTFSNGDPCINIGYNGSGSAGYTSNQRQSEEMSFFVVGEINSREDEESHAKYLLGGVFEKQADNLGEMSDCGADGMILIFGFNSSGLPTVYARQIDASAPGSILYRTENVEYESYVNKLFYILYTCSNTNCHIYINGVEQQHTIPSTLPSGKHVLNNYARLGFYKDVNSVNYRHKIASIGMLNIDLSKPENAAYLDTLNSYIASKYTLEDVLVS